MSALEQEIMNYVRKMDEAQQKRVLALIRQEMEQSELTLGQWLKEIDTLREELETKYGSKHFPSVVDMLNEIREERVDDILNSLRR